MRKDKNDDMETVLKGIVRKERGKKEDSDDNSSFTEESIKNIICHIEYITLEK